MNMLEMMMKVIINTRKNVHLPYNFHDQGEASIFSR